MPWSESEKKEFAFFFKDNYRKSLDTLFYDMKERNYVITKMEIEFTKPYIKDDPQPFKITVTVRNKALAQERIVFYGNFHREELSANYKDYQFLSFHP
jgi:hypothetical protein